MGITELLGFLSDSELVIDRIGIEGTSSLGLPLTLALSAAGYDVWEVQPNRTAERRRRRRRAKTDIEDAEAVARETLSDLHLPPAGKHFAPNAVWDELTAIHGWRSSLVLQRVRQLTEAEAVLVALPMGIWAQLPSTSRVLPQLEALEAITAQLPEVSSASLIHINRLLAALDDIYRLTWRIKDLDKQVRALLAVLGCTLTEICGVGTVTAMELLVEVGDPCRFLTEAQFARWCGATQLAVSSGEGHGRARRHRLDRGGNREVNSVLHIVHVTKSAAMIGLVPSWPERSAVSRLLMKNPRCRCSGEQWRSMRNREPTGLATSIDTYRDTSIPTEIPTCLQEYLQACLQGRADGIDSSSQRTNYGGINGMCWK
jgi:transposase